MPKIALVDDDRNILTSVSMTLEAEGFEVLRAMDGVEAISLAEAESPDLIILDVMMPRMDGLEACRRIRARPALKSIPIVMLTARGEESDQVSGLDVGADIYLTKPISIPVFIETVKRYLDEEEE